VSATSTSPEARSLAARLVWGSLEGHALAPHERPLVEAGLGGVVLFSRNVESPEQVQALVEDLRAAAPGPIHVAVDQEGGHVVRLREPLTRFPSSMALGAAGSERLARAVAAASGRELAALGIDVVLAPDLDVALDPHNPTLGARTFGSDPSLVARLGAAMVEGYLVGGVLPVAKHAPGHGRTPIDSHLALPVVRGRRRDIARLDLPPFVAAVAAGVPALMAAHVVYAALDPRPASVSKLVIEALLRHDLAFDGLVVTDALVMDAIARRVPIEEAAVEAIRAGADVAMVLEPAGRAIDAIASALERGVLERGRVRQAIHRVEAFAARAGPPRAAGPGGPAGSAHATDRRDAGTEAWETARLVHAGLAREVAEASLTLVRDDGLLPLARSSPVVLVDLGSAATSPVEDAAHAAGGSMSLADALRAVLAPTSVIAIDGGDLAALPSAIAAAERATLVILATRDAFANGEQRGAVARLVEAGRPIVHVALRSPVDLALGDPGSVRTAIAAYSDVPATCAALASALVRGRAAFPGRLPMPIPAVHSRGEPDPVPVVAA